MTSYHQSLDRLIQTLKHHDTILAFQKAEQKLQEIPELESLAHDMKTYQQDAVLFAKIDKKKAEREAEMRADELQEKLSSLPIVQDYRDKMQDASDLIQYVTKTLETKINEELANGK